MPWRFNPFTGNLDETDIPAFNGEVTLGSAANPSIFFSGDTNTGIYSPGADQVAISTNGTGRLFVDASGNVGIGINTPESALHVAGASASAPIGNGVHMGRSANYASIQLNEVSGSFIDFSSSGTDRRGRILYDNTSDYMSFGTVNGSERLRITSAGLVGVGTSEPIASIHSVGTSTSPSFLASGSTQDYCVPDGEAMQLGHWNSGTTTMSTRIYISSAGRVGMGTTSPSNTLQVVDSGGTTGAVDVGPAANQARIYAASDGIRFGSVGNHDVILRTINTERLRITSDGKVGVGTTSPAEALHVSGNIRMSAVPGTNTNAALNVLFQTTDGTIDGGSTLTFNPGSDVLSVNGCVISSNFFSGAGSLGTLTCANGSGQYDFRATNDSLRFISGSSEAARFDGNQRLLVGTSTASAAARPTSGTASQITPFVQFQGNSTNSDSDQRAILFRSFGTTAGSNRFPFFGFVKSRGSSADNTIVALDDGLGGISFQGTDGTQPVESALISAAVDGTPGANDMPGRLVFSTTADDASSPTEAMRINARQQVLIGGITPNGTEEVMYVRAPNARTGIHVDQESTGGYTGILIDRTASDGDSISFTRAGALVGAISVTATATAYNTSSDYRLKENVVAVTDSITRLQQLKPSRFNFIADPGKTVDGFLAHEVQTVIPEAVTGEKDAVNDDGNPVYQGIDQSKIVPLLTAALQEAIAKIETLEQRLNDAGIN